MAYQSTKSWNESQVRWALDSQLYVFNSSCVKLSTTRVSNFSFADRKAKTTAFTWNLLLFLLTIHKAVLDLTWAASFVTRMATQQCQKLGLYCGNWDVIEPLAAFVRWMTSDPMQVAPWHGIRLREHILVIGVYYVHKLMDLRSFFGLYPRIRKWKLLRQYWIWVKRVLRIYFTSIAR